MKKIGIACDNYKLPMFKKKLKEAGFEPIGVSQMPNSSKLMLIKLKVEEKQVEELKKVCEQVELFYTGKQVTYN